MEEIRYFFSPDGTQSFGPVTISALRQLVKDQVLTATSYLRAENKTEWQEIELDFFAMPEESIPTEVAPLEAEPAPPPRPAETRVPFVPKRRAKAARPPSDEPDLFAPFAAAAGQAPSDPAPVFQAPSPAPRETPPPRIAPPETPVPEVPVAVMPPDPEAPIISVPHYYAPPNRPVVSAGATSIKQVKAVRRPARGEKKSRTRGVLLTLALICVAAAGALAYFGWKGVLPKWPWFSHPAPNLATTTTPPAPIQIQTQGYEAKNPEEAARKIQTLKEQIGSGNTDSARISRDFLGVASDLLAKTKRCDQLGKTCNFDVTTLTGAADITAREETIAQLNDAQEDVVKFLKHFNDNCRAVLLKDHFSETAINQITGSLRESGHVDLLIALWQAEAKLSADQIARLEFLARGNGTWSIKDGKLIFPDDKTLTTYNGFVHDLQDDVQTISGIQKQISS